MNTKVTPARVSAQTRMAPNATQRLFATTHLFRLMRKTFTAQACRRWHVFRAKCLQIARDTFRTDDVKGLLAELRTNPEYTFNSEQHMLDYISAAVARGEAAVGDWFSARAGCRDDYHCCATVR